MKKFIRKINKYFWNSPLLVICVIGFVGIIAISICDYYSLHREGWDCTQYHLEKGAEGVHHNVCDQWTRIK